MKLIHFLSFPLLLLVSCAAPEHAAAPSSDLAIEHKIFTEINSYRNAQGLESLHYSSDLAVLARQHSYTLTRNHKPLKLSISHEKFAQRVKAARAQGMVKVGENVGASQQHIKDDVTVLVHGWINSKDHHKTIVGNYNTTGIGVYTTPDRAVYATQLFGSKE